MKKTAVLLTACLILPVFSSCAAAQRETPSYMETAAFMKRANDYYLANNPVPEHNGWEQGAYFTGNMAAYNTTKDKRYLQYALDWGDRFNWEIHDYYDFEAKAKADNQCCGQTYLDLYTMYPEAAYMAEGAKGIKADIDKMLQSDKVDDWWWVDAMYMAAPIFTKLYAQYQDERYLDKMYALYASMKNDRKLYDTEEHLWYRDERFLYPAYQTGNGKKCFWSRGNGWVFAAHARVLAQMPETYAHRAEFVQTFTDMAKTIKKIQGDDGFWRMSLYDAAESPDPETSGTAFFTYGLAWGINAGLLPQSEYLPVVQKAWNGLTTIALNEEGRLGWVQKVSDRPVSAQSSKDVTTDYGVGAFLLAGSEIAKFDKEYDSYRALRTAIADSVVLMLDSGTAIVSENKGAVDENPAVTPYLSGDTAMLPLRFIAENTDMSVVWDDAAGHALLRGGGHEVIVTPESGTYVQDGVGTPLPQPAELRQDRLMVPLRAVAEALGKQVYYDDSGLIALSDRPISFASDEQKTLLIEDMKNDRLRLTEFTSAQKLKDIGASPRTAKYDVVSVAASDEPDAQHKAAAAADNKPDTYWSAAGEQSVTLDLGSAVTVSCVGISFPQNTERKYYFDIAVSKDGEAYDIAAGPLVSKKTANGMQFFYIPAQTARFVRINAHGNEWHNVNMIAQIEAYR